MARVDDNFMEEQKILIEQYCLEMNIDDVEFDEKTFVLEEILNMIDNDYSKKIILLEIMAVVYADDILHEKEQEVIDKICKIFKIDSTIATLYAFWTKSIMNLYKQGEELLKL
jgi:transcriptional regulator CtsR